MVRLVINSITQGETFTSIRYTTHRAKKKKKTVDGAQIIVVEVGDDVEVCTVVIPQAMTIEEATVWFESRPSSYEPDDSDEEAEDEDI
jgi:hypothetical protein